MAERSVDEAPVDELPVDEAISSAPTVESTSIRVTIRYFAAARAAAGVPEEQLSVSTGVSAQGMSSKPRSSDSLNTEHIIPAAHCTVGQLLDASADRHGPGLARVLARCSFLLDEVAVHGRQTPVLDGQVLDVLPPFAGG